MKRGNLDKWCSGKVFVVCALLVQFLLLFYLNFFSDAESPVVNTLRQEISSYNKELLLKNGQLQKLEINLRNLETNLSHIVQDKGRCSLAKIMNPDGVALLLMTDQPKWFQRRYTLLIQNLLFNLPNSWIVQIFHPDSKQFQSGVELNPGFKRLIEMDHPRLQLTKIPREIIKARKRPIHLMLHPFIWENTLAEKVLYLDGNHVLCANSPYTIEKFIHYDYIGAPGWGMFKGIHLN